VLPDQRIGLAQDARCIGNIGNIGHSGHIRYLRRLVSGLVGTVDCYVRVLVQDSYRELVGPNTLFATALTGLLTIYIALVGYQILFGRGGLRVTDLPVAALKVGLILAFLTSWAAYQTVFFNLLFDGPRDILHVLLQPMARMGAGFDGDVYGGLERAYADMSSAAGVYGGQASPAGNILQGGPMLGSGILWMSSIAMLLCTVGVILAVKIILAFLLAIGPIFIGLFLFEPTRGLFDGWLRTTIAFALAPLATNVFAAAMLLMLQPFLAELTARAEQRQFDMGVIITLGLIVAIFVLIITMAMRMGASIASGFNTARHRERGGDFDGAPNASAQGVSPDRAEQIAARIAAAEHARAQEGATPAPRRARESASAVTELTPPSQRLGQAYRRQARPRPTPVGGA
jgi:type IV secretion system protein VirB6